jgi:hypothetical protein
MKISLCTSDNARSDYTQQLKIQENFYLYYFYLYYSNLKILFSSYKKFHIYHKRYYWHLKSYKIHISLKI